MTAVAGVPYEADLEVTDSAGVTRYDVGFPINAPIFKGTDTATYTGEGEAPVVGYAELNYEIGGETGLVNRVAYTQGGIANYTDAHDFRGDHLILDSRFAGGGTYGDVGASDDYASQYALAVAAQGYGDVTREQSWDDLSGGF